MIRRNTIISFAAVAIFAAAALIAGPLNPPAGPVASTYKTLTEVEPRIAVNSTNTPGGPNSLFRITQPGSYYLTGNITGVSGKTGIEIASPSVTVDLSGFTLQGVAGSLSGISTPAPATRGIVVRNGVVRDWGGSGVDFETSGANQGGLIEGVHAIANGSFGIRSGFGAIIRDCTATENIGPTSFGFVVYNQSVAERCVAYGNRTGFSIGAGARLVHCSSNSNTQLGFTTQGSTTYDHCTAHQNTGTGFSQSVGGAGLVYDHCAATSNSGDGFIAIGSVVFMECTAASNGAGTGAGIRVSGADARIEGCTLLSNGIGLVVTGGCFVVRNTASGNTPNYSLSGTNTVGPIIAATGTITSTSPWANFEY